MQLNHCKFLDLPKVSDDRGDLTFVENANIPFNIQRIYYLYNVPANQLRGAHGHRELEQVIIPINGSFDILLDDGTNKKTWHLNDAAKGLYVAPMMWRDVYNFSPNAVCLVLASLPYSEADYFRQYNDFLTASKG